MSDPDASLAISEQIGAAVEHAVSEGRQIANAVFYNKPADAIVLLCFPFAVIMNRNWIPEFQNISPDALETLNLSPSGATLILESENLYIETAGLVMRLIASIRAKKVSGSVLFDLLQAPVTT